MLPNDLVEHGQPSQVNFQLLNHSSIQKYIKRSEESPTTIPIITCCLLLANAKCILATTLTLLGLATTFASARAAVTKLAALTSLSSLTAAAAVLRNLESRAS